MKRKKIFDFLKSWILKWQSGQFTVETVRDPLFIRSTLLLEFKVLDFGLSPLAYAKSLIKHILGTIVFNVIPEIFATYLMTNSVPTIGNKIHVFWIIKWIPENTVLKKSFSTQ